MTVWATRADQVDLRGPNPHDLARSRPLPAPRCAGGRRRRSPRPGVRRAIRRLRLATAGNAGVVGRPGRALQGVPRQVQGPPRPLRAGHAAEEHDRQDLERPTARGRPLTLTCRAGLGVPTTDAGDTRPIQQCGRRSPSRGWKARRSGAWPRPASAAAATAAGPGPRPAPPPRSAWWRSAPRTGPARHRPRSPAAPGWLPAAARYTAPRAAGAASPRSLSTPGGPGLPAVPAGTVRHHQPVSYTHLTLPTKRIV